MVGWSRGALGLSCMVGLGLALRTYLISPARVPVHYGITGVPDRWGSPLELFVALGCCIGVGTVLFLGVPELLRRAPDWTISIPNKHYWLSPEHRALATAKLGLWADLQGTAVNLLMITLLLLPGSGMPMAIVVFGAFTIGWCVWLSLAYRLPRTE